MCIFFTRASLDLSLFPLPPPVSPPHLLLFLTFLPSSSCPLPKLEHPDQVQVAPGEEEAKGFCSHNDAELEDREGLWAVIIGNSG